MGRSTVTYSHRRAPSRLSLRTRDTAGSAVSGGNRAGTRRYEPVMTDVYLLYKKKSWLGLHSFVVKQAFKNGVDQALIYIFKVFFYVPV